MIRLRFSSVLFGSLQTFVVYGHCLNCDSASALICRQTSLSMDTVLIVSLISLSNFRYPVPDLDCGGRRM